MNLRNWTIITTVFLATLPLATAQKKKIPETSEVFRVSRAGVSGAAESRELLMELYQVIGDEYNANLTKEEKAQKTSYRGKQVRILQVLKEKENGAPMYIAAYGGKPSVIAISDKKTFKPGDLTPALKIEENGEYETEVTREIVERSKAASNEPSLEKADSGGVSFFGIPIDTGGSSSAPPSSEEETVIRRRVKEVRKMPKYKATVSDEVLSEGPEKFSKDLFLDNLKNGSIYTVQREEERRCQTCRGFQRITTTMPVGRRDPDGKMPCPSCRGIGKKNWNVTYQVAW